jgi:adenosylhomocysteinase
MSQLRLAELDTKGVRLENGVHDISVEQDQEIAGVKLRTMGMRIDKLTPAQKAYNEAYSEGT